MRCHRSLPCCAQICAAEAPGGGASQTNRGELRHASGRRARVGTIPAHRTLLVYTATCLLQAAGFVVKKDSTTERGKKKESADKPGSVEDNHSSAIRVATYLKRPTREHVWATRAAPSEDDAACSPIWSCSGRGLPCRRVLPPARCALTAPFHPYRPPPDEGWGLRRFAFCCTFRGLAPPRRYLAPCPGSPDFPPRLRAAIAWPTPPPMVGSIGEGSKVPKVPGERNRGNSALQHSSERRPVTPCLLMLRC